MGKPKGAHHRGTYQVQARSIRLLAALDPETLCWSCSRTLAQIRQAHPTATWTAGHVVDGEVGGDLLPECSPCNYGRGAAYGNRRRGRGFRRSRTW